ncbi:hypothetical protein [Massilia sp. Se16.2.3]|uniref:hypothetical protein n=1 Tax=Massilia sp. Se16.2.3 TaxID=2709303 RepID=UPI001920304A|nr:hypothetical protein [Massilia sp. Se16.2.3]
MIDFFSFAWLHDAVSWLLAPALAALLLGCALALLEGGIAVGERFYGLARLHAAGDLARVQAVARRRLERADLLARIPPMLGLMATIIPLGPGLAALGQGRSGPAGQRRHRRLRRHRAGTGRRHRRHGDRQAAPPLVRRDPRSDGRRGMIAGRKRLRLYSRAWTRASARTTRIRAPAWSTWST